MTEPSRRMRGFLAPALAGACVLGYLMLGASERPIDLGAEDHEPDEVERLRIVWVDPVELSPGAALVAELSALEPDDVEPIVARLSAGEDKAAVETLRREGARVVIRIPENAPLGANKLRFFQGDRKTKPWHIVVRPVPWRAALRDLLGGLALFVLGTGGLARALRNSADRTLRERLARTMASPARGALLGTAIGAALQSLTSGAVLLVSMAQARILAPRAVLSIVLGMQLGVAAAAAALPLLASREALLVVAVGVLLSSLADNRPARAAGNTVLSIGLVLLGLGLLQSGFRVALADPVLLSYLPYLSQQQPFGALSWVLAGALLCALMQSPGPVLALLLGIGQASGMVTLEQGLWLLAGTALGGALSAAAVTRVADREHASFRSMQLLAGVAVSAVALALVPLLVTVVPMLRFEAWLPAGLTWAHDGVHALHPELGPRMAGAFVCMQLVSTLVSLIVLEPLLRAKAARASQPSQVERVEPGQDTSDASGATLLPVLEACRSAIIALGELLVRNERSPAVAAERALATARQAASRLLREHSPSMGGSARQTHGVATACMHVASATDAALRIAERALALDYSPRGPEAERLEKLHSLLVEAIEELIAHVDGRGLLSLEDVQAREIRLNALEAEMRSTRPSRPPAGPAGDDAFGYRLWITEQAAACEAVGNSLYRLATALAGEASDAA